MTDAEQQATQPAERTALVFDVKHAAAICRVSAKTIYRAVEDGRLKAARLGQGDALRIRMEWIDEWIEASVCSPQGSTQSTVASISRSDTRRGHLAP